MVFLGGAVRSKSKSLDAKFAMLSEVREVKRDG